MNSITKDYLAEIIFRKISETIDIHRQSKKYQTDNEPYQIATDAEVLDFIISIPYFDDKLKDFLIGNLVEHTIIISQSWENEFIKKTKLWVESFEWLHGDNKFFNATSSSEANKEGVFLTLPY